VLAGISAPVLLVVGAIAALGVAFATNWSQIQPTVMEAVGNIQARIAELQPIFEQMREGAASVVAWFVEHWPQIQATIQQVMDVVGGIIVAVVNEVVPFAVEMFGKIVGWVVENWPLIHETVSTVLEAVWSVISTILDAIGAFWSAHGDAILNAISLTWDSIKTVISTALDVILGLIKAVMQMITGDWEGAWETVKGVFVSVWDALQRLLLNHLNTLLGYFDTNLDELTAMVAAKIVDIIESIRAKIAAFRDAGRRLIDGLREGVLNAVGGLISAVTGAVQSAIDAARRLLGVSSPSRLFEWIGAMSMLGMVEGILSVQEQVVRAAAGVVGETVRVVGMMEARRPAAGGNVYDQRRIVNTTSTVNVNGVGLGALLMQASQQV
jgi:phage-related protein